MGKGNRMIFHIDVNSAYLSWEAVDRLQHGENIDLRDIPSVVGGDEASRHGIVLTKSIPAKKYGIKTGESLFEARNKCPNLVIVPPRYSLYMQCSNAMIELLKLYSPVIQRYSVDEVFLDYTGMQPHFGEPVTAAHTIKEHIKSELGFTVNIGISCNKLLAKMASELKKPDKVHTLFKEEIPEKMWPLPVEELFMVGSRTAPKLKKRGINTIGDLAKADIKLLQYYLKSHGTLIWNYANGIEDSPVKSGGSIPIKGLGNSTTIAFDVIDRHTAHMILLALVETVSMRLRDANYRTQLVSVSIKTNRFLHYSHQRKLLAPTDSTKEIYFIVCKLFDEAWKGEPIRHLGIRLSELCSNEFFQTSLFNMKDYEKKRALDRSIDDIRLKYGSKALFRASFLHSGIEPLMGGVIDDYPMMSSLL